MLIHKFRAPLKIVEGTDACFDRLFSKKGEHSVFIALHVHRGFVDTRPVLTETAKPQV